MWRYAVMAGWLAIMAYVIMLAVSPRNWVQATFARAVVGCVATYLMATVFVWQAERTSPPSGVLPHEMFKELWASRSNYTADAVALPATYYDQVPAPEAAPADSLEESEIPSPSDDPFLPSATDAPLAVAAPYVPTMRYATYSYDVPNPITSLDAIAAMNCAMGFGFMGGGLAVLRNRRVERAQAKQDRVSNTHPLEPTEIAVDG